MNQLNEIQTDWSFSNIPNGFDVHVREQLPWYDLVLDLSAFIVRNYVPRYGVVYDIGSATGNMKRILHNVITERQLDYITIDNTEEMNPDICNDAVNVDYFEFDVAILNLTMMFIPVKYRSFLINKLLSAMNDGGCIILVDKFIQPEDYISTVLRRATLYWKYCNGVNCDDIVKKEISLSGIQIPLSHSDLPENSKQFFKFGEFEGYVIQK